MEDSTPQAQTNGQGPAPSERRDRVVESESGEHSIIQPAVVCDLGGTIREPTAGNFVNEPEEQRLIEGRTPILNAYIHMGFVVLGLTNQPAVAFGNKTPLSFSQELEYLDELYHEEKRAVMEAAAEEGEPPEWVDRLYGNPFDMIRPCFSHEDGSEEPWTTRSLLRKPKYGGLAVMEWDLQEYRRYVDWTNSVMVGDRPEDAECARAADLTYYDHEQFFVRGQHHPFSPTVRDWVETALAAETA